VDDADDEAFRKDPSRPFAFWEADPDPPQPMDALQDYATIRIRVPMDLRPGETLALSMPSSKWVLRRKIGTGKDYLKDAATAEAQLESLADPVGQPTGPFQGRWEIPHFLLRPGMNEFLMRCDAQPDGRAGCPDTELRLERVLGINARPILTERIVDIASLPRIIGGYTARLGPGPFSPSPRIHPLAGWTPVPFDAKAVTLFVHGFNVSEARAFDQWIPTIFKRLYWVGHSVLRTQDKAHLAGVTWPGDEEGDVIVTPEPFYPENEFNALRTGVAFARFLHDLRARVSGRSVNILAHSLGNMVVNSGIQLLPPTGHAAPVRYVMNQAAIAAEAFDEADEPSTAEVVAEELESHARTYGMDDDLRWEQEWRDAFVERNDCPPEPSPCGVSDYNRWHREVDLLNDQLQLGIDYRFRWRLRRPKGRGQWAAFFAANLRQPGITIYNSFNRLDYVLRVDQGVGDRIDPHAWFASQRRQKPNVGLGVAALDYFTGLPPGSKDGRARQFWALLGGASSISRLADQEYLWGNVGDHSHLVRQWAELAHWFPAASAPVGVQPLRSFIINGTDRNIPLDHVGGSKSRISHSFVQMKTLPEVWPAFERFRSAFAGSLLLE
jgi:hypothetical protein